MRHVVRSAMRPVRFGARVHALPVRGEDARMRLLEGLQLQPQTDVGLRLGHGEAKAAALVASGLGVLPKRHGVEDLAKRPRAI
jgi:hypothetical protein